MLMCQLGFAAWRSQEYANFNVAYKLRVLN